MRKVLSVSLLLGIILLAVGCSGRVSRTATGLTETVPADTAGSGTVETAKTSVPLPATPTLIPSQTTQSPTASVEAPGPTQTEAPSPQPGQRPTGATATNAPTATATAISTPVPAQPSPAGEPAGTIPEMIARVKPSVVKLVTDLGTGSGMIFETNQDDLSAYVLTNYHVIEASRSINVEVGDSAVYDGLLLGSQAELDLAVVQICCSDVFEAISFGDASIVAEGTDVIAIGYPLTSLVQGSVTVTRGIVSAIRFDSEDDRWLIQTDAAINRGNSGGPLLTFDGKVIGVNTVKITGEGIEGFGFAVSEQSVKGVLLNLKSGGQANPTDTAREIPPAAPGARPPTTIPNQSCDALLNCLVYGESRSGVIAYRGEIDAYFFDGKMGDEIAITGNEDFLDTRFELGLALFDTEFEYVLFAGEAGYNQATVSLIARLPSEGRYTILVAEVSGSSSTEGTGGYTISIKNLTGPNVIEVEPTATPVPTPTPIPLPDLTVGITSTPKVSSAKNTFINITVEFSYKNTGNIGTELTFIPVTLTLDDLVTERLDVRYNLSVTKYESVTFSAPQGACYEAPCNLRIEIDPANDEIESNEGNNVAETTVISEIPPPTPPDLIIRLVKPGTFGVPRDGSYLYPKAFVTNLGESPAIGVTVFFEVEGLGVSTEQVYGEILGGETRQVDAAGRPPLSSCYNPTCTIRATVDPDNLIAESDEDNNVAEETFTDTEQL